jgi:hypothetical protein
MTPQEDLIPRERIERAIIMFELTEAEKKEVVTNCDHLTKLKFSPYLPYAFTEHGALVVQSQARAFALPSRQKKRNNSHEI